METKTREEMQAELDALRAQELALEAQMEEIFGSAANDYTEALRTSYLTEHDFLMWVLRELVPALNGVKKYDGKEKLFFDKYVSTRPALTAEGLRISVWEQGGGHNDPPPSLYGQMMFTWKEVAQYLKTLPAPEGMRMFIERYSSTTST